MVVACVVVVVSTVVCVVVGTVVACVVVVGTVCVAVGVATVVVDVGTVTIGRLVAGPDPPAITHRKVSLGTVPGQPPLVAALLQLYAELQHGKPLEHSPL